MLKIGQWYVSDEPSDFWEYEVTDFSDNYVSYRLFCNGVFKGLVKYVWGPVDFLDGLKLNIFKTANNFKKMQKEQGL